MGLTKRVFKGHILSVLKSNKKLTLMNPDPIFSVMPRMAIFRAGYGSMIILSKHICLNANFVPYMNKIEIHIN